MANKDKGKKSSGKGGGKSTSVSKPKGTKAAAGKRHTRKRHT